MSRASANFKIFISGEIKLFKLLMYNENKIGLRKTFKDISWDIDRYVNRCFFPKSNCL